ncbi:MAG: glycoside hydrolase family 5 protein [Chitinispirillaceae bacterium]
MQRMRGVNLGGWLSQIDAIKEKDPEKFPGIDTHMETFISEEDFIRIRNWGFDHVRLPVDFYLFFDENEKPIEHRLKWLDQAVLHSRKHSLRLILDLHECPGHDFAESTNVPVQQLFADDSYVKKTETIWSVLSERYGSHDHTLLEVLNEPVAPTAEIWNNVKDRLCRVIRHFAPKSPIVVGSNMWNWPSTYNELTPVEDDSVIYSVHFYEPLLFTHQNAPWLHEPETKVRREYPGDYGEGFIRQYGLIMSRGRWDRDRFLREMQPVETFRKKHGVDVICNEFGVYTPVPLESQLRWYNDLLSVLEEMGMGFSYWNYKNLDFGIISRGEQLHEKLPQYDNPERVNLPILSVLQKY